MYGKFFASAFTGSMMASGADVFAVWAYVIANTVDSKVELNPRLIAVLIGTTVDKVETAITYLCAPDPMSRSKNDDGCRLIREGEYQFFVPNHAKYRSIRDEAGRREYNRLKQQEHRQKSNHVKPSVKQCQQMSTLSAQAEADTDTGKQPVHPEQSPLVQVADQPPPKSAAPKGKRLPKDWVLPKNWGVWALNNRPDWVAQDVRDAADRFKDYWVPLTGPKATKLDWEATWRNWVRKEPKKGANNHGSRLDQQAAIIAAVTGSNVTKQSNDAIQGDFNRID